MNLSETYEALLASAGMTVSPEGLVSIQSGDDSCPMTQGGKRWLVPTRERVRQMNVDTTMAFHVLNEQIERSETEVLVRYREALKSKLNVNTGLLVLCLLRMAASVADQGLLSPAQTEYLSLTKDVDEKTVEAYGKIMESLTGDEINRFFVDIFVRRSGVVGEKTYARLAVVSFPFYEELVKADDLMVRGVKLRVKDHQAIMRLMEYIFPDIAKKNAYSRGNNGTTARTLIALMDAFAAVAGAINDQADLFANVIERELKDDLIIPLEWQESLANVERLVPEVRLIPMSADGVRPPDTDPPPAAIGRVGSPAPTAQLTPASHMTAPLNRPSAPVPPAPTASQQGGKKLLNLGDHYRNQLPPAPSNYGAPYQQQMPYGMVQPERATPFNQNAGGYTTQRQWPGYQTNQGVGGFHNYQTVQI